MVRPLRPYPTPPPSPTSSLVVILYLLGVGPLSFFAASFRQFQNPDPVFSWVGSGSVFLIEDWIRVRFFFEGWIWIRIKVKPTRTRNPALKALYISCTGTRKVMWAINLKTLNTRYFSNAQVTWSEVSRVLKQEAIKLGALPLVIDTLTRYNGIS